MSRKHAARQRRKKRTVLVRPIVSAWTLKHYDDPFSADTIELAESILRRNDDTLRIGKFSPSSANKCMRASVMQFMGYPSTPVDSFSTLNRFQDGNYGHLFWQMIMWEIGILEKAEFPVSVKKYGVAGTCDGILSIPDFAAAGGYDPRMSRQDVRDIIDSGSVKVTRLVAEIKRMAPYRFQLCQSRAEPEPGIVWQGSLYYMGAKETLPKAEANRLKGVCYWLESKDNNDILEFDLAPTEQGVEAFDSYYSDALDHVVAGTLPPRPYENGSRECNGCFQNKRCNKFDEKGKKRIKPWKGINLGDFATEVIANHG